MRLLTVTHFFEAHGGGIERVAGQLCREFSRQGQEAIWAASDRDVLPFDGIVPLPLRCIDPAERLTGLPMPLPGIRAVRDLARQIGKCDAVIIHDALYVTSILAMLIAKRRGKRVVLVQHISEIPFSSRLLKLMMALANRLVTRPMMRFTDELVFISDTVREDLVGSSAWRDYRLLFNGVDTAIFNPATGDGEMPGAHIPWPPGKTRILFVGRYVEKKGLSVIRALAELRPDLSFLLAGSGVLRPSEWELVNVHDLGARSQSELAELYRSADLLLLPSVGEGYPLVIQEAMACGLPVVCGQPADRADPNAARWLRGVEIDLNDPKASAERCARAIDSVALSQDERASMVDYAAHRYSWQEMAESLVCTLSNGQPRCDQRARQKCLEV